MKEKIKIDSVVQINENMKEIMWVGCFVQVSEIKDWGIQGWINIPKESGTPAASAYIRLKWDQIDYIGQAVMVPFRNEEDL